MRVGPSEPAGRSRFQTTFGGCGLYKIWNRMSSGSYLPPPVKAVRIPKSHGDGVRVLGVPTIADRVAQTVVARRLEGKVEAIFHPDSYGYRPNRSALDAVAACRRRCWKYDWAVDLDVQAFLDASSHCCSCSLSGSEQAVLGGGWLDTQAFSASGGTWTAWRSPRLTRCNRVWRV